jgi:hypothetical protein
MTGAEPGTPRGMRPQRSPGPERSRQARVPHSVASPPEWRDSEDPLAPARGLVIGLIAGVVLWAALALVVWALLRA